MRAWWLLCLLVGGVMAWITPEQILIARQTEWRIQHWARVEARIDKLGETRLKTFVASPDRLPGLEAILVYTDDAGKDRLVTGRLLAQAQPAHPGKQIPILIDPAKPEHWTDRITTEPLIWRLLSTILLAPVLVVLAIAALVARLGVLKLWRTGVAVAAEVIDTMHTAVAPRSRMVRCTLRGDRNARLIGVTIPTAAATHKPGDVLWLIVPSPENPNGALPAELYDDGHGPAPASL